MSNNITLDNLNKALQMEMSAAHQYQLHAHVLDDWGLNVLADKMREEQAEEMGHSDLFIKRIMFLKGTPDIAFAKTSSRAATLKEMFELDLGDEEDAIEFYLNAARQAYDVNDVNDVGSRMLFETIALDEEGHKGWLELQLELIERLGEQAYSAKNVSFAAQENNQE